MNIRSLFYLLLFKYHNQLALNAFVSGNNKTAEKHFLKLIELFPVRKGLHYNCALAQMGLKKFEQAEKLLLWEIDNFGNCYARHKVLADLYYISENFQSALKAYQTCKQLIDSTEDSKVIALRIQNCEVAAKHDDIRKSFVCYEKGSELLEEETEEAEKLLLEACTLDSSNFLACNNLGVIYMNCKKDYLRACKYFKQSLELSKQPVVQRNLKMLEKELDSQSNTVIDIKVSDDDLYNKNLG